MPFSSEWSSTLEALAAIAGLIATIILLWLNRDLLDQNRRLIDSTAEASRATVELSRIESRREAQRVAPILVMETDLSQGDKTLSLETPTVYEVIVRNLGFGPAIDCNLHWTPIAAGGVRLLEIPEPFHIGSGDSFMLRIEMPASAHFGTVNRTTGPARLQLVDEDDQPVGPGVELTQILESSVGRIHIAFLDVYGQRDTVAYDLVSNDNPESTERRRTRFFLYPAKQARWLVIEGDEEEQSAEERPMGARSGTQWSQER